MGKWRYGIIIDAGSSGSRIYVYRWLNAQRARESGDGKELESLPQLTTKKKWTKKIHPGVSTFGETPELVGPDHLAPLIEHALDVIPKHDVQNTPVFMLATAGMRLLPDHQREALLQNVCTYFRKNTNFQLPDCNLHIQVIPGETEGLYGWIAANYLLRGFDDPESHDHGNNHHTYGFLDMGGASAQIAFAPNSTEAEKHSEDLKLLRMRRVNGDALEYRVFVTTWLGYGANEARRRYVQGLVDSYPDTLALPDPCLPTGLTVTKAGQIIEHGSAEANGKEPYLAGTGKFSECLKRTYPLLDKDKPCVDQPCLLNGVHTPAIDFAVNHFVGVSEYWHTTHELFSMAHKDKAYDFHTYQQQVTDFCSRDWKAIEHDVEAQKWGKKVDVKTVEEVCFKASWLINMLHDGIGIPREGLEAMPSTGGGYRNKTKAILDNAKDRGFLDPFQAVDKIEGTEVSWTLGKMVLYASSQMPPAADALAVGFGSNVRDNIVPSDFQYAGGNHTVSPDDLMDNDASHDDSDSFDVDDVVDEVKDKILATAGSRRAPGIILFLVILALAVYLLCGRERRLTLHGKFLALIGRKPHRAARSRRRKGPGFLGAKFFGGTDSPAYEHVLEDGDYDGFELADVPSDEEHSDISTGSSSDPPRTGRTSGWATPSLPRGLSPDVARTSPKNRGYLDGAAAPATGLGITPFEQGGLVVRTESKERLTPKLDREWSRTGSPKRSPLMTPFKEKR